MNRRRSNLTLLLCLAYTLTASAFDVVHDHRSEHRAADCVAACDDVSPHVSGHASHDTSAPHAPCAACLVRMSGALVCVSASDSAAPRADAFAPTGNVSFQKGPSRRPTGRAPPLV